MELSNIDELRKNALSIPTNIGATTPTTSTTTQKLHSQYAGAFFNFLNFDQH